MSRTASMPVIWRWTRPSGCGWIIIFYVGGPPDDLRQGRPIPPERVAEILPALAANARAGAASPPSSGSDFQDVDYAGPTGSKLTAMLDPDGTDMGPPLPPP